MAGGTPSRRGPRPRLDLDAVVDAAIALADDRGLAALTMRALAARLRVSAMTLYGYVPGREELVDLMLDALYGRMAYPAWEPEEGWRAGRGRWPRPTGRCTRRTRGRRRSRPRGRRSGRV